MNDYLADRFSSLQSQSERHWNHGILPLLQSSPFPFIFNIYKFHDTVQLVPLLQSASVNNCPLNLKHKCTKYLFYDHTLYRVESVITKLILHRKLPSFPHCTPPKLFYRVAKIHTTGGHKDIIWLQCCRVAGEGGGVTVITCTALILWHIAGESLTEMTNLSSEGSELREGTQFPGEHSEYNREHEWV